MDESRFWDSCPKDIEPYIKAQKIRFHSQDQQMWLQGMYFHNALSVSLSHFCGNKRARYVSEPMLSHADDNEEFENLTESKKEMYVDHLFTQLMVMESNFNRTHKKH